MAGRYRALLIGNSTYPADEHNLQTLRGPVKDIAALNRALVDRDTGLFADVDVTLLPEATSTRTIRSLSRFFGAADRDDVLLVYFSGHGRLDQRGRLHLCMQDTESTDLLSTAVSSTRINEFADASRARNVVIVLDCCYAGAFRGGDLGDAVAGPGRYVLTSCRGSQLANDATVENGTSFFTQHLVEGLISAAADQDGDGYVSFSDLYAYIDRRLREAGKQIPQRRVDGDGDLPLAKRPRRPDEVTAAAERPPMLEVSPPRLDLGEVSAGQTAELRVPNRGGGDSSPASTVADDGAPAKGPSLSDAGLRPSWAQRRVLIAIAAGVVVMAGGAIAALLLLPDGSSRESTSVGGSSYIANAPWRLRINGRNGPGDGCTIALTEVGSRTAIQLPDRVYGIMKLQIHETGSFKWQVNDSRCLVTPLPGSGTAALPFVQDQSGDSDAFPAPSRAVLVEVKDYNGNSTCVFRLLDPANGQELDFATAEPGADTVMLQPNGRQTIYLRNDSCGVRVSAQP